MHAKPKRPALRLKSIPPERKRQRILRAYVLSVIVLLPGCALLQPEIRYVPQTIVADCPKPKTPALDSPYPTGYFLNQIERALFGPDTKPTP